MMQRLRILITGASGFLGSEMVRVLSETHTVFTLGTKAQNDVVCNLAETIPQLPEVDIIVHAAGKAHSIPKTTTEKQQFFDVNTKGTENLLRGITQPQKPTVVFVSSVAVYGKDFGENISENQPLEGNTPYAQSKIEAEIICQNWAKTNHANLVILRLPLISGTNPPGNLGAMAKAIKAGYYFRIGAGTAKKSMVAAGDVAALLPLLYQKNGTFNLTDGHNPTLAEIENHLGKIFGKKIKSLPLAPLRLAAKCGDVFSFFPLNTLRLQKLTASLTFADDLARKELHWQPKSALANLIVTKK